MSRLTTYSFVDINMTFSHPAVGVYPMNGEGVGDVNISYPNDNTAHDVAADGSVMTSKMKANNATITMTMQQTSPFHQFLLNWFNAININTSLGWAGAVINIQSRLNGENVVAIGVAPQKRPDQPYQKQGTNVTWTFMAADCSMKGSLVL